MLSGINMLSGNINDDLMKGQVDKSAKPLIVVPERSWTSLYSIVFPPNLRPEEDRLDDVVACVKKLDHPIIPGKKFVYLVGSCNGLICLENTSMFVDCYGTNEIKYPSASCGDISFTLWNPSTGIYRTVPDKSNISPSFCCGEEVDSYCYFAYDNSKDDYHIVRTTTSYDDDLIIDVYSLKNDSWTKNRNPDYFPPQDKEGVIIEKMGVVISGTLYLECRQRKEEKKQLWLMIAFDIFTQSFRLVQVPPISNSSGPDGYFYDGVHGRLSAVEFGRGSISKRDVWLMDIDGGGITKDTTTLRWKKIEIETSKPFLGAPSMLPYSLPVDGGAEEVLLLQSAVTKYHEFQMVWCDLGSKKSKNIILEDVPRPTEGEEGEVPIFSAVDACVCSPFFV